MSSLTDLEDARLVDEASSEIDRTSTEGDIALTPVGMTLVPEHEINRGGQPHYL